MPRSAVWIVATLLLALCRGMPLAQHLPGRRCFTHPSPAERAALENGVSGIVPRSLLDGQAQGVRKAFVFNVSFTIVHTNATAAGGWIDDARVAEQMAVLNADFASTGIAWVHTRTTRVRSADWFISAHPGSEQEQAMKRVFGIADAGTLNVYTLAFNATTDALGAATLPSAYAKEPHLDGVLLRHGAVTGGARMHYNLGRTLTHEVGHWLGLLHTFEGGCDEGGDGVADTPPAASGSEGCPVGRDSCPGGGPDLINNFMDYSYDACMSAFTPGQAARMRAAAWAFRKSAAVA